MKDYSMNKDEQKNFVLSYRIEEDTIFVKFATGEEWTLAYTEKNEQKVLDKMKKQVTEREDFIKKQETKRTLFTSGAILFTILSALSFSVGKFGTSEIAPMVYYTLSGLSLVGVLASNGKIIKINSLISDFNKNKYFLLNEEKINGKIRDNENIIAKTSNKTKTIVEDCLHDNEPVFNINTFNHVPYSDIQQIMSNIERDEFFGFDYDSEEVINASVKKKTRKM